MRKAFVICLTLALAVSATSAFARAPEQPRVLQGADITERPTLADPHLATEAAGDTFVWGPFDFQTGFAGWTSKDFTLNDITYAHTVDLTTIPGGLGLGTTFSAGKAVWVGELGANTCGSKACFPGYINGASQMLWKQYTIPAGAHLTYKYRYNSEPGYDYTYIIVSRAGDPILVAPGVYDFPGTEADRDTLNTGGYTGSGEGSADFDLSGYGATTITFIINSNSDAGYSDEDCNYNSTDGLFEIDDVGVTGNTTSTFESSGDGWTFARVAGVGNFAAIQALSGLPMGDPCPAFCGLSGNVVTIYDPSNTISHPLNQNEAILSPTVDLTQNSSYPVGSYVMQFDVYANLDINNGNFYYWHVRYQPVEIANCSCLDATDWSPWLDENTIYYGGGTPVCGTAFQFNVSAKVPGHAQRLQMAVGALNYAPYVAVQGGNQSPYFDNISLRAAKVSAPAVVRGPWDLMQDSYPNAPDWATAKSTPGKIDNALNIFSPSRRRTRLGDSSLAQVALSCNSTQHVEVDYLFKVTPGPCLNTSHPWWVAYLAQPKIASGRYAGFAVARADTAKSLSNPNAATAGFGTFMSCFNELAPASGTTYSALGNWSGYTGGAQRINIFPDDVFTPGTHIEWVVHTTYIPTLANGDYYAPDPKYGNGDGDRQGNLYTTYNPDGTFVEETSVLPFTTQDGNTAGCGSALPKNCFLYVDRDDQRGTQAGAEIAFRNLGISYDRYDVRAPTSAMGNDLGSRFDPLNYANGDHAPGPLPALLNSLYKSILWATGTNNSTNFAYGVTSGTPDAGNAVGLLDQWLRTTTDGKYLWVSGDGNVRFLNNLGTRFTFLSTTLGAVLVGPQYRDHNSTWGVTITGVGGTCTASLSYGLRANWCPQRRSYNEIDRYTGGGVAGTNLVNWDHSLAPYHAAVQDRAHSGGLNFDTQTDAFSLTQLIGTPPPATNSPTSNFNVTQWTARSLSLCPTTACFTDLTVVGVNPGGPELVNSLKDPVRNPIVGGETRIDFTLREAGNVTLRVYDVSGRLVGTPVLNQKYGAGASSVVWDPSGLKGGVYFYQIEANGFKSAKKIVLVN